MVFLSLLASPLVFPTREDLHSTWSPCPVLSCPPPPLLLLLMQGILIPSHLRPTFPFKPSCVSFLPPSTSNLEQKLTEAAQQQQQQQQQEQQQQQQAKALGPTSSPAVVKAADPTALAAIDPSLLGMFMDSKQPLFDEPFQMFSAGNFSPSVSGPQVVSLVTGETPPSLLPSLPLFNPPTPFMNQTAEILEEMSSSDSSPGSHIYVEEEEMQSLDDQELLSPLEKEDSSSPHGEPGVSLQSLVSRERRQAPGPKTATQTEAPAGQERPASAPAPACPQRRRSTKPQKTVDEKRERNRLAAERYRKRGRDTISTLADQCTDLVSENEMLLKRNKELETEVAYLRQILERSCLISANPASEMEPFLSM